MYSRDLCTHFCVYTYILKALSDQLNVHKYIMKLDINNITQDLIEAIDKVDQEMQAIGLPSQYPIEFKIQMCHLSLWFVNVTVNLLVTLIFRMEPNAPILKKITVTLGKNIMHIMLITVQLSFTVWVGHIGMKFRQLNQLLEEMIETFEHSVPKRFLEINDRQIQNRRPPNIHAVEGSVETITKAKNCHLDLIKIARRINKFYGMQLLLTTLIWLLTIVTLLYILNFCIWQTRFKVHLFYEIGPVILWLMLTILRIIYLHSMCMQTSNEAGKTGFLLCRLYSSSTSVQFRSEVQHFTTQVLTDPLVFNVCGLVDIDLILQLVGSIFTYLIVIIQLAGPELLNTKCGRRFSVKYTHDD
ncbi:uncharacterized protein LOC143355738 [Halictus rubicundus]|uniref:uncharacterized protein LOC143355738 n=1 Tax=Halictus rubicundus TaxID=77578 RepID=UPI0040367ABE